MGIGLQNRSSVMGVVIETTEAKAKKPTAGTDFIALQSGFQITPQFEELQSAELQAGSIGKSKSVLGNENPTCSFSHYMRHSGVEGQAPNFSPLVEALFGSKVVTAVERSAAAASTTKIVKLGAGLGVNFKRGQALLVKDPAGYSIRNVLSVVGDDLHLSQALPSAPGAGVNLGKAVLYEPAVVDHPTLTIWNYRANGGAIEAMSGSRVLDMSMNIQAGQQINASFNLAGVEYFFNPIEILATNNYLDFLDDATTRAVTVAAKLYKDPNDLASAIQTAMNALGSANVFTVTYSSSTGKFTIASDGATFELHWNTGAHAANSMGAALGFSLVADDTGALSYVADSVITLAAPYNPSYDTAQPLVAKSTEVMLGGEDDTACFGAQSINIKVGNQKSDIPDLCEDSGKSGSIISERDVTVEITALLKKFDVDKFTRFREGMNTALTFNAGEKSGGNWIPGKCVNFHIPTGTLTAFSVAEQNGLCVINLSLRAYVESGKGEVFLNFV